LSYTININNINFFSNSPAYISAARSWSKKSWENDCVNQAIQRPIFSILARYRSVFRTILSCIQLYRL